MSEIILPANKLIALAGDNNRFASVSVHCGEAGCAAAREMTGRRHLLDEAPTLPLPQCSADACKCRYFRYGDRRSLLSNRRTHGPASGQARNWLRQKNRRSGRERRKLKIDFRRWLTARDTEVEVTITP